VCCTSRSFANRATTFLAPLASRSFANRATTFLAPLASRVPATLTLQQALPLALLRVRAARRCRLALRAHAAKLAIMLRAARVFYVLQAV